MGGVHARARLPPPPHVPTCAHPHPHPRRCLTPLSTPRGIVAAPLPPSAAPTQPPRLVISVSGAETSEQLGTMRADIERTLKHAFSEITDVWFLTSGLGDGVSKQVGKIVSDFREMHAMENDTMPVIGIVPWSDVPSHKVRRRGRVDARAAGPRLFVVPAPRALLAGAAVAEWRPSSLPSQPLNCSNKFCRGSGRKRRETMQLKKKRDIIRVRACGTTRNLPPQRHRIGPT